MATKGLTTVRMITKVLDILTQSRLFGFVTVPHNREGVIKEK